MHNEAADFHHAIRAIRRLNNPEAFGSGEHELASRRPTPLFGRDMDDDDDSQGSEGDGGTVVDEDGVVLVNSLSHSEFRECLVAHFDILFRQNKVKWPERSRNNNNDINT